MKKALSILLCLAMLISTVPMAVFAAPTTVTAGDSALELAPELSEEDGSEAELAAEKVNLIFEAGRKTELIDEESKPADKPVDSGVEILIRTNPTTFYKSTDPDNYELDGRWTDGTIVYERTGTRYAFTEDIVLYPNVVPKNDGYEVHLTVDDAFAGSYNGWGKLAVAVGETIDLTSAEFALTPLANYPILGWKNVATGKIVESVTGVKDEVVELTVASAAKPLEITLTSGTAITENDGTLELSATVAPVNPEDAEAITSTEVTWAIVGGETTCATLEGNVLKGVWNTSEGGGVIVSAIPVYDPSQAKQFTITVSGQIAFDVAFHANTSADVTVPEGGRIKGTYEIPAEAPVRAGYRFEGWMTVPEDGEVVSGIYNITEDTDFYAKWSKGGLYREFEEEGDTVSRINKVSDMNYENGELSFVVSKQAGGGILDAQVWLDKASGTKGLFHGSEGTTVEVRIKADMNIDSANHKMFFTSVDENDAPLNTVVDDNAHRPMLAVSFVANEYKTLVFDMSTFDNWKNGYITSLRFDPCDTTSTNYDGATFTIDYIRVYGKPTVEHFALDIEAPVAEKAAYGMEAVSDASSKYQAVSIAWEGDELLGGRFFNTGSVYTAKVELETAAEYALSEAPATVTVNGNDATFVVEDGKLYAKYTFAATEGEKGDLSVVNVNLHTKNDDGDALEQETILAGKDVDLNAILPVNVPTAMRWVGWALEENGEAIDGIVNNTEEKDYYALYEVIAGYDFANKYHHNVNNVKATNGTLTFDGMWAVVDPKSDDVTASLTLDGMYISSANFDQVEVIYDGSLEDENVDNRFSTSLVPALKVYGSENDSYTAVLTKAERVIASEKLSYKYTYNIAANGKPAVITALEVSPYKGKPVWGVTSVKLVENIAIEDAVKITGVKAPETWNLPDESIEVSENYKLVSIDWSSEGDVWNSDGSYKYGTAYTVTIVVKGANGYKITVEDATIDNAEVDSAVLNAEDGTLTIVKTFAETAPLDEFVLTVDDGAITEEQKPLQLTANFEPAIDNMEVTWEVLGDDDLARIDPVTGVLSPRFNGTVTVRATSKYNPEVFAEASVVISGQVASYTVTYDANTASTVTGMPFEDNNFEDQAKFEYVLPTEIPVREGFSFAGWTKTPGEKISIAQDYITEDTTYYALWVKGYNLEFISQESDLRSVDNASTLDYSTPGEVSFTAIPHKTHGGLDMQIKIGGTGGTPLFKGGDYTKLEVRVKGSKAANTEHIVFFTSQKADGSALLGTIADTDGVGRKRVTAAVGEEYTTLEFDMSGISNWTDGYIDWLRIDILDKAGNSYLGETFEVDYIRAANYEVGDIQVTGVDAPVAKAVADTDAVAKDSSKYTVVANGVSWKTADGEPLLYDRYFDGNTAYTVFVKVKGASGTFVSDAPATVKINGKDAEVHGYDVETGELTIKYTFAATGELESNAASVLTLYGDPAAEPETITVFNGDKFALGTYIPANVPEGKRWIGWATEEGATTSTVTGDIVVNSDATYYAVFENLVEFDYSNPHHQVGTVAKGGDVLSFRDGLAILAPQTKDSDVALVTPTMNVDGSDFGLVEVYYSALLDKTYGAIHYENIFSTQLKPSLKFSLMSSPDDITNDATLVAAEKVVVGGNSYYKYTYDMSASRAWSGSVAKLCADPYNGYPLWGIGLIKLVPNVATSDAADITVAEPEAFKAPAAPAIDGDKYEIVSAEWSCGTDDFVPATSYTLTVTYKPVAGYKVDGEATATVNGAEVAVTDNGNDTYTTSYTFETEPLKEVEVEITGSNELSAKGRYLELDGKTVATDGSALPITSVTWSIESGSTYAKINATTGRVYPISNGTVVVKATSDYNPEVSATHEIVITNQADLVKVTFNKNTQDEVTGMPDEVYTYGVFVPGNDLGLGINRPGYFFKGWSTDEDALEPSDSFNITEDTVLYAKWGKGFEFNFNDEANSPIPLGSNVFSVNPETGIGTLVYNNIITGKSKGELFSIEGLGPQRLETSIYSTMEVRFSLPYATKLLTFYRNNNSEADPGGYSATYQYNAPASYTRNNPGEFQVATVDFSNHAKWQDHTYLNKVRLDVTNNSTIGTIYFDYIRFPNPNRTVKFDGNGGKVYYNDGEISGEIASYPMTCKVGNIPLYDAVREGYEFLGWAKQKEGYTKLYNNKFPVTDDVTLYAIWGEEGSTGEGGDVSGPSAGGDATTSEGGPSEHPGHVTYPNLGGGNIASGPSYTEKTPSDKKVSVPARPKDDGPLATGAGAVLPEKFKTSIAYDGRFTDVTKSNWFYGDVEKSFRLGLMNGKSAYEFAPEGTVTLAEAITVAARMNATYYSRAVYGATGAQWYVPYVEYAVANSIITAGQFADYKALATREQVANLFVKALPASWYPQKNMFSKIPDVAAGSASEATLLKLYNAGIFTGVDDAYNFKPSENIKRSELSAIINRVALPDSRLRVITEEEILAKCAVFTAEDLIGNTKFATRNCVETVFKDKNGGAYAEPAKADPWIGGLEKLFEDGFVNAEEFKTITVVIRPENGSPAGQGNAQMFFAFDGKYTESMAVNVKVPELNEDGTMTFVHDMSSHAAWAGEVTTLRFDPYNNATPFSIVSITFAP